MSKFDPEQFMANPDSKSSEKLKKDDLIALSKHLGSEIRAKMKVEEPEGIVSQHLIKEDVLIEPASQTPASSSNGSDLSEKYEFEFEFKPLHFKREREERKREREREEKAREFELINLG